MSRLSAALRLRPGEQRLAGWLIALFAVTQSGHGLGSNTGDALLFVRYGVERLPAMIALSGAVAMLATLAYGVGLARMGLGRLLPATALGLATALVVERAAITTGAAVVYPTIWLTEQAVILVTLTMMWNAAAEACDARQAKRLFPVLASAGIAGGVAGNFATGPAAYLLGTENLLLVHAALLVAAAALSAGVATRFLPAIRRPSGSVRADLRAGWTMTARSRFLRLAALAAAGFSALFFLVVFPFAEQVTASFSSDADVAAFLGFFSGAATVAAFLVSLLLANRVFAMVGVVGAVLIATMVYAAGFALWIASFTLATAAAFRAAQWVAVNAIGLTAWNSLFNVADAGRRGAVMAFHTAVPMQIGVIASGALLLAWPGDTRELALLGAGLAAGVAAVVWRMRSEYPTALVDAVRRGLDVFAAAPGLGRWAADADTVRALAAALDDPRPGIRRIAVSVLGRLRAGSERARLVSALRDPEPSVRCAAVDALGRIGAGAVPQMAPLLDDPDPQVRAAAAGQLRDDDARMTLADMATAEDPDTVSSALGALAAWPDAAAGLDLAPLLSSPRPAIRLRAGEVMLRIGHPTGTAAALELLDDSDESVRAGAASLLAARHDTEAALLETLRSGSLDGQEAAARALAGRAAAAAPLAAWAARETERALRLRRHRAALHDLDRSASVAYLHHVLEQRRRVCERRALV
ncbi:MAG TPA: HEAT repeat domain-containing protein, partial [Egibacteraceae bacterium]|nr:HEAT repeat domain-containing protein [Egibacteraceae bacterium]